MNKKIFIKDWLELKPYGKQTVTDSYYLKICNDVKKVISTNKQSFILQMYLDNEDINLLSCFLTSYFEDLISDTKIWNTFTKIHQRLYSKQLPFYYLDEYYDEEVNPQDISFLIWYFLNTIQEEKFISPFNDFIVEIAEKIFEVYDREWEFAPENKHLKTYYQIDQKQNDFYIARDLIEAVLFKTYLFYPDTLLELKEQEFEIFKNSVNNDDIDNNDIMMLLKESRDRTLHKVHTRLLALTGKEWVSEILGSNHLLSKDFLTISKKIQGLFLYKGDDKNHIFIEHIASGKRFNITKKSIDESLISKKFDSIIYMGIVMWKNEWWFSGILFEQPFNSDLILDEKKSIESKMTVNFLDHQKQEVNELLKKQLSAFESFTNGSLTAFLPSDRIDEFYKGYAEFFNNTLNLTEKEIRKAKKRVKAIDFFGVNNTDYNFSEASETGLVFFNPNSGVEIALAVNSAFPMPLNPYFKEEDSEEHVMRLLMDESLSTELAMYCIDNCKAKLSFFTKGAGKKYLEDIDFLLRFWKKDNYHTTPSITYTG